MSTQEQPKTRLLFKRNNLDGKIEHSEYHNYKEYTDIYHYVNNGASTYVKQAITGVRKKLAKRVWETALASTHQLQAVTS